MGFQVGDKVVNLHTGLKGKVVVVCHSYCIEYDNGVRVWYNGNDLDLDFEPTEL